MKILGIETSCDETAVCVLEAEGGLTHPAFKALGNAVYSQVDIHKEYGGVFPMMAKRAHAENLVPMLLEALEKAGMLARTSDASLPEALAEILQREPGLFESMKEHIASIKRPDIDAIAVTHGPGLEPALWVGVNFAKALSILWNIPLLPINHMEGHVVSVLLRDEESTGAEVEFPAVALLISGGHTELVLVKEWGDYEIIGKTKDDAVGEAFDKVARMLDLPYPGGPQISRLAAEDRNSNSKSAWTLPRPMIATPDFDFSFSGLKTAVLYAIKKLPQMTDEARRGVSREFEDAVTDVLTAKTRKAVEKYGAKTLILGGGVTANARIREAMGSMAREIGVRACLPLPHLSTDNALMIAMAAYVRIAQDGIQSSHAFGAKGNLKIGANT